MEKTLGAALGGRDIPRIRDFRELRLLPEAYRDEKIFALLDRYAAEYGEGLVLYGGLTATERVYGLKRIRDITTDLDFACTAAGLEAVLASERILYHEGYDILFSVSDNVPITFAYGHIHDWPLDPGFFDSASRVRLPSAELLCCSRERSIMLKLRRTGERLESGLQPFGKDALDILNILVAPSRRRELKPVDIGELCELVISGAPTAASRPAGIAAFLRGYEGHLSGPEREAAEALLGPLEAGLSRRPGAAGEGG